MNVLYFEGAGMNFYEGKTKELSDVGNFRIRTSFLNNAGIQFYLELGNGQQFDKKGKNIERLFLTIDFVFNVNSKDKYGSQNYNEYKFDHLETRLIDYKKSDIVAWINENLNCSFDEMEVLDSFYGYRVHGNNNTYNLMEDIELNHKRAVARKEAYDKTVEKYVKILNRKYPAISIKEMKENYIILDNHQGKELLKKHNLDSRYEKVLVNY